MLSRGDDGWMMMTEVMGVMGVMGGSGGPGGGGGNGGRRVGDTCDKIPV